MINRQHLPKTPPIPSISFPSIIQTTVGEGIPLTIIKNQDYPIVTSTIVFDAGNWHATCPGVAHLTGEMLPKSRYTSQKTVEQIIEDHGAQLTCTETPDRFFITLAASDSHFQVLFPVVAHMLLQPTFSEKDFSTLRNITAQELKQEQADPLVRTKKILLQQLFSPEHPYGYVLDDTLLHKLSVADVAEHYQRNAWHQAHVYLSGNVTEHMVEQLGNTLAKAKPMPRPEVQAPTLLRPASQKKLHQPSVQAVIRLAHITITQQHPDYAALYCTNQLLGGFFCSRLMLYLREQKGYTYDVHTYIRAQRHAGYWALQTSVKQPYVEATSQAIRAEIADLQNRPISQKELKNLQSYLLGHLLSKFDNPFHTADQLQCIHLHGQTLDHYRHLYNTIRHLTPDIIQRMAQKYFQEDHLHQVILVG